MATLMSQVQALTNLTSDSTTQGYVTQWLNDGCVEIINNLPPNKLSHVASQSTFTGAAAGSEAETLGTTSKILEVFRTHGSSSVGIKCRKIDSSLKYQADDEDNILYATENDPVYYIENSKINTLPKAGVSAFSVVTYPSGLTYDDSAIATFPQEYDYIVVLYTAVKATEYLLATEEDAELYTPMLATLKQDYGTALSKLNPSPPPLHRQARR
jgi:hypothetical protein